MLDRLQRKHGSRRTRLRVGRGIGSGSGKTCGRGTKGAGSRSGSKRRPWYEGGQMPMSRRLPKVGFHNPFRVEYEVVNLRDLARFEAGSIVDVAALATAGLVSGPRARVKLLATGDLSRALSVRVAAASGSARKKVEEAGGSVEIVSPPRRSSPVADPGGAGEAGDEGS